VIIYDKDYDRRFSLIRETLNGNYNRKKYIFFDKLGERESIKGKHRHLN